MGVTSFLEEVAAWAATRSDIIALCLVGSYARGIARRGSDVDLMMLSSCPTALLSGDWPSLFGEVESRIVEDYGAVKSLRVFYREGAEVEFGIAARDWAWVPLDEGTRDVLTDGVRVLYDPEQLLAVARLVAVA